MDVNLYLERLLNKSLDKGGPLVVTKIHRSDKYRGKSRLSTEGPLWQSFIENTKKLVMQNRSELSYSGMQLGSYNSDSSNGFYLSKIEDFDPDWFRFLADQMIENLKLEDYIVSKQQEELSAQDNKQVCWEKHSLHPAIKFHNSKHCQGFGKIQVEVKFVNNRVKLFKLQANYFSGYQYSIPKAYSSLLEALFAVRS